MYLGGESVQITLQLPRAISHVFQGLLLMLLLGCEVLVNYRIHRLGTETRRSGHDSNPSRRSSPARSRSPSR